VFNCERCGRKWGWKDAEDNNFLCTRKCNGKLIKVNIKSLQTISLMNCLPFPAAYPWHMSLDVHLPPEKRVNNMIFTAYQAMRITGLLLLSDYLESNGSCLKMGKALNKMRLPHWQDWMSLTDTLANYMTGVYQTQYPPPDDAVLGELALSWRKMKDVWHQEPLAKSFAQGKKIPAPMEIFRNIRNDRAHRLAVMDMDSTGDEMRILETYLPVLEFVLHCLFDEKEIGLVRRPSGMDENFEKLLEDPSSEVIPLIELIGVHQDFSFETVEYPLSELLREALRRSTLVAIYRGNALPIYPLFISLDLEADNLLRQIESEMRPGTEVEKVTLADGFTEKKVSYLGVKSSVTVDGIGEEFMERLKVKKHELGLSRDEADTWLMVEWARDNALNTLNNLIMKKYFPQCYVVRPMDERLVEALQSSEKAIVVSGEAGSGKSSLLCRVVEYLLDRSRDKASEKVREKHFKKKVKGKNLRERDALQAFMALKGAGDVVIFLSGRLGVPVEGNESMERAFTRALLRACGVRENEFNTSLEFMSRLNENMSAPDTSLKKDEYENRKVWIILDAINEVERCRDFASYLDIFIRETVRYSWLQVICSLRSGALDVFQESHKKKNIHGILPFTDEEALQFFSNQYVDEEKIEPRLNLPSFTPEQLQEAYELRQQIMPERSALNTYERIPLRVKALLASPLYLHLFHETWKGQEADLSYIIGEDALFEAYLDSLEKELPGIGVTLNIISEYFYEQETPIWDEQVAQEYTREWMLEQNIESAFRVCTLTPVETLVSASLLMRQTDDERGFQFSHQKIYEQVLKRKLLNIWDTSNIQSDSDARSVFQTWMNKGERFEWLANAVAGLFAQWVHEPEKRYLYLLPELQGEIQNTLKCAFRAVIISLCKKKYLDEHDRQFIQNGLKPGNQCLIFLKAINSCSENAMTTGKTYNFSAIYEISVPLHDELLRQYEQQGTDLQQELSTSYNNMGLIYKTLGKGDNALEYFDKALQISQEMVKMEPQLTDFQQALSLSYNNVGRIYETLGEGDNALEYFDKALQVSQELAYNEPQRKVFQRGLSVSYDNAGRINKNLGKYDKALEYFEKALQVCQELAGKEPQRTDLQQDLSGSYINMGRIYETLGKNDTALVYYKKAQQVSLELAYNEPQRTDFQRVLSVSYDNAGRIYKNLGNCDKALEYFDKALQIRQELVAKEPLRTGLQHDLSVSNNNIGIIYEAIGEIDKALEYFEKDLLASQQLANKEPLRTDRQHDLSVSYNNMGRIYKKLGKGDYALEFFKKALQIKQELTKKEPLRIDYQIELATSCWNMSGVCLKQDELQWISRAINILLPLRKKEIQHVKLETLWNDVEREWKQKA
jgi:tetratricopeptide (TPR) repeat protein